MIWAVTPRLVTGLGWGLWAGGWAGREPGGLEGYRLGIYWGCGIYGGIYICCRPAGGPPREGGGGGGVTRARKTGREGKRAREGKRNRGRGRDASGRAGLRARVFLCCARGEALIRRIVSGPTWCKASRHTGEAGGTRASDEGRDRRGFPV